jgi:hypothetical protein
VFFVLFRSRECGTEITIVFVLGDVTMKFRSLQSLTKATRTTRLVLETLENRLLLAADGLTQDPAPAASALYGDANLDGHFNSMDLVQVFQAGKYETSQAADWSQGDWNFDGRFDSQDLIATFQQGTYSLGPAAAEKAVPFKGSVQAVETNDIQGTNLFVDASGSGNATHLGRFTVTYEFEVDLLTLAGNGSAHFIAANGDSLFTEVIGQATPTENPDVLSIAETYTITGGTGRFADATGSFTVERLLNAGVSSGSFDGTIVFDKAK